MGNYRKIIQHSMQRRAIFHDYCDPCIYTISIHLLDRTRPILGNLIIDSPVGTPPEEIAAHIVPSQLGNAVKKCWERIPEFHPEVELYPFQLMGEHLHGCLYVKQRMKHPLGQLVAGFKSGCTAEYYQLFPDIHAPLFAEGFHDRILYGQKQLQVMKAYIYDNPRRYAIKKMYPDFFCKLRKIPFYGGYLNGFGNSFLIENRIYYQIQASRHITQEEYNLKREELLKAIRQGAVIVSTRLSDAEKSLTDEVFQREIPIIFLKSEGFPPLYKPSGKYFDACANGRLLILAPYCWPYHFERKTLTRDEACVLNAIGALICGKNLDSIQYSSTSPADIPALLAQAIGKRT